MELIIKIILIILSIALLIGIILLLLALLNHHSRALTTINQSIPQISNIEIYNIKFDKNTSIIDLSNVQVDGSIIQKLGQFEFLKTVNLKNNNLSVDLQSEIEKAFPEVKFVWDVNVLGRAIDSDIDTLDLSNCEVTDIETFKKSISLLHKLKYLDMSDCNLSNEELAQLRLDFPEVKVVWKVYFSVWSLKTDAVAFSVLVGNFKYTYLTTESIQVLKYCTDLQALDLGHQKITDISVIGDYLPNLRILILADNPIKDISPIAKLKHLHYLELFINKVTDISPLAECKELVDLNLCYDYIRDYSPLLNNDFPMLERLWLNGTGISSYNLNLLRKKYPNAKISIKGPGSTGDGWRSHDRYFAMIDMFHKRDYISELFTKYDNGGMQDGI